MTEDQLEAPPPNWPQHLKEVLAAPEASLPDRRKHRGHIFDVLFAWHLDRLARIGEVRDAVTAGGSVISRLVPTL